MKLFSKSKDGGPDSHVDGFFLIEIKSLFSVVLLKFNKGMREPYHTHAFNALTWLLKGNLIEEECRGLRKKYKLSLIPKYTSRDKNHRVIAKTNSWCLTIRGPWKDYWTETKGITQTTLTHGRKRVKETKL